MTNTVHISYFPGSGGHFLREFLDPEIIKLEAPYWVDEDFEQGGSGKGKPSPYSKDSLFSCVSIFATPIRWKPAIHIGLGPKDLREHIQVRTMVSTKNLARSINEVDAILLDMHQKPVKFLDQSLIHIPFNYTINYNELFNWATMLTLYRDINDSEPDPSKWDYFFSYANKHKEIYSSGYYFCIEKIFEFEYNNNVQDKMRSWSIHDVTPDNLQGLLCLTNYH